MQVLWERGSATVGEVHEALVEHGLSYSTVLTTMRILETKGYVRHTKQSHAFIYHPVVQRQDAQAQAVKHLVSHLFQDSRAELVLNVLKDGALTATEARQLRQLVAALPEEV
jgi:predicted transcriptional regulator